MALKPSLTVRMGQQLRMTPQLQQAIRLLQLSTLELEVEIQDALDSNFMLEEVDQESAESEDKDSASTDDIVAVEPDILNPASPMTLPFPLTPKNSKSRTQNLMVTQYLM